MTDLVEHRTHPSEVPEQVVALCDQALTMAGLPTYSAQVANLARWQDTIGARLRVSHGILSAEIGAALAALAVGDTQTGMNLLDEARAFADHHAALETSLPLPANVVHLAAHRVVRVGADLRRL